MWYSDENEIMARNEAAYLEPPEEDPVRIRAWEATYPVLSNIEYIFRDAGWSAKLDYADNSSIEEQNVLGSVIKDVCNRLNSEISNFYYSNNAGYELYLYDEDGEEVDLHDVKDNNLYDVAIDTSVDVEGIIEAMRS